MKRLFIVIMALLCGLQWTSFSFAFEIYVNWFPQFIASEDKDYGTNWDNTMNCGPTALAMTASYIRNFTPNKAKVKEIDDWLYEKKLISAINNYDLVKNEGTDVDALRAAATYLFGMWNSEYISSSTTSAISQPIVINSSLSKGYPVIIGVRTQMSSNGALHWMVATGLRDTNKDGIFDQIKVNDPGRTSVSDGVKWYLVSDFKNVFFGAIYFKDDKQVGHYDNITFWHNDPWYSDSSSPLSWKHPSQPFVDAYVNNGGPDKMGYPDGRVYEFKAIDGKNMYAQEFKLGETPFTLVLNRNAYNVEKRYIGVAYVIHGHVRDYWKLFGQLDYGPPVSNEHYECYGQSFADPATQCTWGDLYSIQWFEPTDNQFVKITYSNETGFYNDLQSVFYTYGEHLNQDHELNSGYKKDGYGIGAGGGEYPYGQTERYSTPYTLLSITSSLGYDAGPHTDWEAIPNW